MWTFPRYRLWLEKRTQWFLPDQSKISTHPDLPAPHHTPTNPSREKRLPPPAVASPAPGGRLEIEPVEGGLKKLLRKFEES
jgi:hypothetical protein